MPGFRSRDFSEGPAMVMPPTNDDHMPPSSNNASFSFPHQEPSSLQGDAYFNHSTSWTPPALATSISTNPSRKRSRDFTEYHASSDNSYGALTESINTPASIPEESLYGEGMVLLNPSTGLSIGAESQTGTWCEEKAEAALKPTSSSENEFTSAPIRKVVRLDPDASSPPHLNDVKAAAAPDSPPKSSKSQTTIDDFTYTLGIGWTRVSSEDPHMEAAARGWARYLDNHYSSHVQGAQILLQSKGLNAYLVGSQSGFFLFSEDLSEGRLVGRDWDKCLNNLRVHPIAFEGEQVLRAAKTPGPETPSCRSDHNGSFFANGATSNGVGVAAGIHNTSMELD